MSNLTPPLKWHGGKHYLADWIISYMPRHVHYVEPYAGGLAVLLRRDPHDPRLVWNPDWPQEGVSEVVNDIDGELMNFWGVLRRPADFAVLRRFLEATPFSEELFNAAGDVIPDNSTVVDRAWRFFVRCRQSRQGLMKDFATLSRTRTRRGMNEQISSWLTAIEGLPDIHRRLQPVLPLNRPALEVIRTQDGPKTLFYLDPTYLDETRVSHGEYGEHEMSPEDHHELSKALADIKGKFLLSGYPSTMYAEYAAANGWHRVERQIDCKASGAKKKPKKTECLWMNFEPMPF